MRYTLLYLHNGAMLLAVLLLLALCDYGTAASFRSNALGARARALGGAYVAIADDTSAAFWNPAGLANVSGQLTQLELKLDRVNAEYTPLGGTTQKNFPRTLLIPALGVTVPLHNEHWPSFELLGYVPYGAELVWDKNAAFNFNSTFTELRVLSYGAATAYRANDRFAVGAGVFVNSAKSTSESQLPSLIYAGVPGLPPAPFRATGDDTVTNCHLGVLWKVNNTFRVGAAYRSPISLVLSGSGTVSIPGGPVVTEQWTSPLKLPPSVSLGFAWQASPVTLVAAQADWVGWSTVDKESVHFLHHRLPDITIARDWNDRVQLRAGVEYKASAPLALRLGYSYDPSPVPDHTEDPMLIDFSRNIVAAGIGYTRGNWSFDFTLEHYFIQQRTTTNSVHPFPTNATYDGAVKVAVFEISYCR